jgi:hypothetical protein
VLHCALVLRDASNRRIIQTRRLTIDAGGSVDIEAEKVAEALQAALWQTLTLATLTDTAPSDTPLEIRMHDASLLLTRSPESWTEMAAQLQAARAANPSDPQLGLMWGMCLYARLLGASAADIAPEFRGELESQIEAEALASLPRIGDNPLLVLGAAKLLYFAGRGHEALAERLAEQAFAASTAFAASFAVLGQIRAGKGDIDAAVTLFEHGLEMSEPGSEFEVYLLVLKVSAHLADGDRAALAATRDRLFAAKPATRATIGLFLVAPEADGIPPELAPLFSQFDAERAQRTVTYLYYVSARLYRRQEHRENIMRGLITQMVRRFGTSVIAEEVRRAVPGLMEPAPGG